MEALRVPQHEVQLLINSAIEDHPDDVPAAAGLPNERGTPKEVILRTPVMYGVDSFPAAVNPTATRYMKGHTLEQRPMMVSPGNRTMAIRMP